MDNGKLLIVDLEANCRESRLNSEGEPQSVHNMEIIEFGCAVDDARNMVRLLPYMDWAFMLDRGEPLHRKWQLIPDNVDVLSPTDHRKVLATRQTSDSNARMSGVLICFTESSNSHSKRTSLATSTRATGNTGGEARN